ncbi:hypothetical protein [Sporosarcina sp. FSL W7-1283]|uniref:hypothetical protein n=1 Tax=Sporosarcina sp. FSL W7-1283 TaxID=2921560 RepID=UPI0030F65DB3
MILSYHIEIAEKVEDNINALSEEETTELIEEAKQSLTKWLQLNSFNLVKPIKVEFDLEEE